VTKIIRLEASNVKRLRAVEIAPDGNIVIVGGRNAQGKTSVLDAIMYALAGKATVPAEPIRKGERRARIELDLDNGLHVERTFDASGSKLVVKDKNGDKQRSPQTLLNDLCGAIAFDPLAYSRMDARKQGAVLRELVGIDTTIIDNQRTKLFDDRTSDNRDLKKLQARLDAMVEHDGAPTEEVSVAKLTDEIEAAGKTNAAADNLQAGAAEAERKATEAGNDVSRLEAELAAARKKTEAAEGALGKARLAASHAPRVDLDPIREQLRTAEDVNARVRANKARAELAEEVKMAEDNADYLTEQITKIDDQKRSMLEQASFPVEGLGFDEDGVLFEGVPLEQASQAQRVRVSVAMGLAMNPQLRVLLVRDASLLDDGSMAMMATMAEEADAQLWLERVGDGDEGAIIIEDGAVLAHAAEDAAQ
jgi:DNA repair exonuclease SbcCD ATPase subunit